MGSEVIILPIIFGLLFGIAYLFFSTRNKERLALIEKGADANIFVRSKKNGYVAGWKIFLINFAVLLMSIGLAVFIAALLVEIGLNDEVAYPGSIFLMAGLGLFIGFTLTKKLEKED